MNKRDFLAWGAILATTLSRAQAQRARMPFRIGLFPSVPEPLLGVMREAMSAAGWQEGRDYEFVSTGGGYDANTATDARRLIAEKVDLVLVNSTSHALALRHISTDVPIVMWGSGYPVEAGLAVSLARPGKSITGVTSYAGTGIWGKLLQLLCEVRPGVSRIGVAWGYVPPSFPKEEIDPCYRELNQSALALGAKVHIEAISRPEGVAAGLAAIAESKPDAMLITAGPGFYAERHRVMQFAISKAIPTAADWLWPPDGELRPLLTYSPSHASNMRQVAPYIVRILGSHESASNLPFQLPARFELLLNRRTAKAIGLTIPGAMLARADAVID